MKRFFALSLWIAIASIVAGSAEPELKAMAARLAGAPGPGVRLPPNLEF